MLITRFCQDLLKLCKGLALSEIQTGIFFFFFFFFFLSFFCFFVCFFGNSYGDEGYDEVDDDSDNYYHCHHYDEATYNY